MAEILDDSGHTIAKQLHRNAVALISLVLAVTSLGYNTWRNERTEYNRNVRAAAFQVLIDLGELQRVVFLNHYDRNEVNGNPRHGWAYVLTIQDLARIAPEPLPRCANDMKDTWGRHWPRLGKDQAAADEIGTAIDACRRVTQEILRRLN